MREMISMGKCAEKSATASNEVAQSSASRYSPITSRIIGSSDSTRRGVNTRLTSARSRSCSGGSIMMIILYILISSGSLVSVERSMPCELENVSHSRCAASTSAKRDSA